MYLTKTHCVSITSNTTIWRVENFSLYLTKNTLRLQYKEHLSLTGWKSR